MNPALRKLIGKCSVRVPRQCRLAEGQLRGGCNVDSRKPDDQQVAEGRSKRREFGSSFDKLRTN
jgi:hypothetical protein